MSRKKEQRPKEESFGWYKYQNTTGADFVLPKPLINGRTIVPANGTFEADSYYQNMVGIKLIENLNHYIDNTPNKHSLNYVEKPNKEPEEIKVLTEQPISEDLEFFESNGEPVKLSNKEKGEVDMTRKELLEFANLKNIKISANMTKEKILEKIRKS